jgi:hypothetical protein
MVQSLRSELMSTEFGGAYYAFNLRCWMSPGLVTRRAAAKQAWRLKWEKDLEDFLPEFDPTTMPTCQV